MGFAFSSRGVVWCGVVNTEGGRSESESESSAKWIQ
ncbi:uncharacterized protein G2W53_041533 [Senna tora]|uniref:Uncharacterized protein n=1 Tax=Senna tora TaxID=362788 RepID=A0A834SFM5_9FABA|nr:uncharacterized protein G2W53_041533 [Senna tora]